MERLYAFSFQGEMLFFSGTIPENEYDAVERIANTFVQSETLDEYVKELIRNVSSERQISLTFCPIEYVFRIRRKVGYHVN